MRTREVQLRVSLTGRYATALYKEAVATKNVDTILQDIRSFQNLLTHHQKVEQIFKSKFIQTKHVIFFIEELAKFMSFSAIFINFLKTLVIKRRGNLVKYIFKDFMSHIDIETNTIPVRIEITSKNKKNFAAIEKYIKKSHPKHNYRFDYHENPELMGGFRAFIYDHCLDYSLKSRLNRLFYQLKEA